MQPKLMRRAAQNAEPSWCAMGRVISALIAVRRAVVPKLISTRLNTSPFIILVRGLFFCEEPWSFRRGNGYLSETEGRPHGECGRPTPFGGLPLGSCCGGGEFLPKRRGLNHRLLLRRGGSTLCGSQVKPCVRSSPRFGNRRALASGGILGEKIEKRRDFIRLLVPNAFRQNAFSFLHRIPQLSDSGRG